MPFQIGQRVGDYEIVQLLGAGGMGHVYRVRNVISNRTEAMKVLLPDLTTQRDLAMRFLSEIRTLASFDHPNIAQLHTALMLDNQLIMMMEFVEGYTLEQLAKQRTQSLAEVSGYASQALSALSYAHERGVIHRDIKPANLMVTSHGILKLMDFGIAKSNTDNLDQTRPGTTIGSLYYMSPEQVRGDAVDPRSDLYAMGVVLYEMLAGRRPFEADSTFSVLNQQLNTAPQPPIEVNPALPPRMNEIILKALAKDPAQRFQSAEDFRTALRPFVTAPGAPQSAIRAEPPPQPAPPAPPTQPLPPSPQAQAPAPPPARRAGARPLWLATGALAAVLAIVLLAFALPSSQRKTHAATETAPAPADPSAGSPIVAPAPATAPIPPTHPRDVPPSSSPEPRASAAPPSVRPQPTSAPILRPTPAGQTPPQANTVSSHAVPPVASSVLSAPGPSPELEQAEERIAQIKGRATAAGRAVAQIRGQQEAQGLGMRSDIENAQEQLQSFLNSANSALARGDGAAATRALDKADVQLSKLEQFLGH